MATPDGGDDTEKVNERQSQNEELLSEDENDDDDQSVTSSSSSSSNSSSSGIKFLKFVFWRKISTQASRKFWFNILITMIWHFQN